MNNMITLSKSLRTKTSFYTIRSKSQHNKHKMVADLRLLPARRYLPNFFPSALAGRKALTAWLVGGETPLAVPPTPCFFFENCQSWFLDQAASNFGRPNFPPSQVETGTKQDRIGWVRRVVRGERKR